MLISLIITALAAFFTCSIFKRGLYFFPVFFASIVLKLEILSLFKAIRPFPVIFLDVIFLLGVLYFWKKQGKPIYKPDIEGFLRKIYNSFKLDKVLLILMGGFIFLFIVSFLLSAFCSVNEADALSYHVFRAFVWANKGYIHHFITPDVRNIVMPINSEIIYTWIAVFTKKDTGFGLLSFFSWLFSIGVIAALLREYKCSIRKILWCVFVFSSLTGIIAQISSTQTDLLTGSFLLFGYYSYLRYLKYEKKYELYFSTAGIAIAMGIKSTGVIGALGILIIIAVLNGKNFKKTLKFLGFLIFNFIIFSSYNYILNFVDYGNPLGSIASIEAHRFWGTFKNVFANFIRYLFQMVDFSGFKIANFMDGALISIQNWFLTVLNIDLTTGVNIERGGTEPLSEQNASYGVLGFLVMLPCVFYSLFKKKLQKPLKALSVLFILNLVLLSASIAYMVYNIRFIACFVVLCTPLFGVFYFKKNNFYKITVALLSMFYMVYVPCHLNQRPFFELASSYKKADSYEIFAEKLRCSRFDYMQSEDGDYCGLIDYVEKKYSSYKKIGFFPNNGFLVLPFYLKYQDKIDILLLNRLEEYDMEQYDLLVINSPYQKVWNFYKNEKMNQRCSYYARKDRNKDDVQKNAFRYVSMADCAVYYEDMDDIGFKFDSTLKIKSPNSVYSFWVKK